MGKQVFGVVVGDEHVEEPSCVFEDRDEAVAWAATVNAEVFWVGACPFARVVEFDFFPRGAGIPEAEQRELLMVAHECSGRVPDYPPA